MVNQYPDSIVLTISPVVTQNSDGTWTAATGTSVVHTFDCRAEVNGTGRQVAGKDGSLVDYAFEVYLPVMTTVIPPDTECVLTTLNNGTLTEKVKRASNGQLNSRLWL